MRSKYEFETPEDRITQVERLFTPARPGEGLTAAWRAEPREVPAEEQWKEKIYLELDHVASGIHAAMQDILLDFERAKRTSLSPRVKKEYDQVLRLHYWRSNSLRGVYLQWSIEESKPYLTVGVFAPLDKNDRKLPEVLQRVTGVRSLARPVDRTREDEMGDLPVPFTRRFDVTESPPSRYGFFTIAQRRQQLARFLAPLVPTERRDTSPAPMTPLAVSPSALAPTQDTEEQALQDKLNSIAGALDETIRDVLADFELAQGTTTRFAVKNQLNKSTGVHYWRPEGMKWRSEYIKGVYLLWSAERQAPYLLMGLAAPLDHNSQLLGTVLERESGLPVIVEKIELVNWAEWQEPQKPIPPSPHDVPASRYGFSTAAERRMQLETFFARTEAPSEPEIGPEAARHAASSAEAAALQQVLAELKSTAERIDEKVSDILSDFELAQGVSIPFEVRKRLNRNTQVYFWRPESLKWRSPYIAGAYLLWSADDDAPYILLALYSYADANTRMLASALERETGLRVVIEELDLLGPGGWEEPASPMPMGPAQRTSTKYGFATPEDFRRQLEIFLRPESPTVGFTTQRRHAQPVPSSASEADEDEEEEEEEDANESNPVQELARLAKEIDKKAREILAEFEQAKGSGSKPRIRKEHDAKRHLHYWTSPSLEGLYLQWMDLEQKPHLTAVVPAPVDSQAQSLSEVLEVATGIKTSPIAAESRDRLGMMSAPSRNSQGVFTGTRWW